MGLMPAAGANPFTKLDSRSVVGTLKASGARDPDILYAERERLLAPPKQLKLLAMILVGVGAFMTVTVILAIAGIPSILFGVWVWRFGARNVAAIDAGYNEYVTTLAN